MVAETERGASAATGTPLHPRLVGVSALASQLSRDTLMVPPYSPGKGNSANDSATPVAEAPDVAPSEGGSSPWDAIPDAEIRRLADAMARLLLSWWLAHQADAGDGQLTPLAAAA